MPCRKYSGCEQGLQSGWPGRASQELTLQQARMTRGVAPGTWKALAMALVQLVRSLALKAWEEGQRRGIKCGERVKGRG